MAHLEASIIVNRSIEEVFTFTADLNNAAKWRSGIIEGKVTSEGPVGVGTTYRYVVQVMGRKLETSGDITAWEPPTKYEWKATSGPFPMHGGTNFEAVEGGTRVTEWVEAEPGGFFKLAEPLLIAQQKGQTEADLKKLKELLEKAA